MENVFIPSTLKVLRDYKGFTQKQMAEFLDLSQAHLSKIEAGVQIPDDKLVSRFSKISGFPLSFFCKEFMNLSSYIYYRSSATLAKKHFNRFEGYNRIIATHIKNLSEYVDIPEFTVPISKIQSILELNKEVRIEQITDFAKQIRIKFGLGLNPIEDIVKTFEKNGIIVFFYDYDFLKSLNDKKLDGFSTFVDDIPVVMVNKNVPNSRKVFTMCHELGHLIFHYGDIISYDKEVEKEANIFASEFLMPSASIENSLRNVDVRKLVELKHSWKVSMAALLYRAKYLGAINEDKYRRIIQEINALGFGKNEPMEFDLSVPSLLKNMFDITIKETNSDKDAFLENILGVNRKVYDDIYHFGTQMRVISKFRVSVN